MNIGRKRVTNKLRDELLTAHGRRDAARRLATTHSDPIWQPEYWVSVARYLLARRDYPGGPIAATLLCNTREFAVRIVRAGRRQDPCGNRRYMLVERATGEVIDMDGGSEPDGQP